MRLHSGPTNRTTAATNRARNRYWRLRPETPNRPPFANGDYFSHGMSTDTMHGVRKDRDYFRTQSMQSSEPQIHRKTCTHVRIQTIPQKPSRFVSCRAAGSAAVTCRRTQTVRSPILPGTRMHSPSCVLSTTVRADSANRGTAMRDATGTAGKLTTREQN